MDAGRLFWLVYVTAVAVFGVLGLAVVTIGELASA
jgi:hypothetical protein